jgi:CHAT domain-containing protein
MRKRRPGSGPAREWRGCAGVLLAGVLVGCAGGERSRTQPAAQGDTLLAVGEALYWRSEYDSAESILQAAADGALARSDPAAESRAHGWLSRVSWRTGDYPLARARGEAALELALLLGRPDILTETYNTLGLIAWNEDRLLDARGFFDRAIETGREAADELAVGRASGNRGLVLNDLGDVDGAREGLREMLRVGREQGESRFEANALANLAMIDIWTGHPRDAIATLDSAIRIYRATANLPGEQNALGQLATAYMALDDPGRAFALYDSSLVRARDAGLRDEEAELLRLIAGLHRAIGDLPRSLRLLDEAAALDEAIQWDSELANVRRQSASVRLALGDADGARRDVEQSLRLHRAAGSRFDELDDLVILAGIEHLADRASAASAALRSARLIAEDLGSPAARSAVALADARIADANGDAPRVLRVLTEVEKRDAATAEGASIADTGIGPDWEALSLAARAYQRLGQLDSAAALGLQAVDRIEMQRATLGGEMETALVADRSRVYADLALTLIQTGREAEAFSVADRVRSRELLLHLETARTDARSRLAGPEAAQADELLRRIDQLINTIGRLERNGRERSAATSRVAVDLASRLATARGEYETLLLRSAKRDPGRAALSGLAATSAADVQSSLQPGEALLEYLVTDDRVLIFVLRNDSLWTLESNVPASRLAGVVRTVRDLWSHPSEDWRESLPAARTLYRLLVSPAVRSGVLDGIHHLVLVPHGVLASLPFNGLVDETSGRYLVEEFTLSRLPLAAALPVLRQRPDYGLTPSSAIAFAPFPDSLPASRLEVDAVLRALPTASAKRIGRKASERNLRAALETRAIVHVATHGILNARHPMFSRIEMAAPSRPDPANDGRLEVHEIPGLHVRSPLVFLSGCETGVGSEWSPDPSVGSHQSTLAQALLNAGAGGVVATFWRIDDAGAAEFAKKFYQALGRMLPADALAAAQRAMMHDTRYGQPFYWAAYFLNGGVPAAAQEPAAVSVP